MITTNVESRETHDVHAVRELGVRSGLDDSEREGEDILVAWGAYAGDVLVGAIVLERRAGLDTVNWMAVDEAWRRRGIASRLYAVLETDARRRCMQRLWVTARNPAFFMAQGYTAVPPGREADSLLGECPLCAQFGRTCTPQALTKRVEAAGPGDPRPVGGAT